MDRKKIILVAVLILTVFGSIGAKAHKAYRRLISSRGSNESAAEVSGSVNQSAGIPTINSAPAASPVDIQALSEQINRAAAQDQDLDGLSDSEEKKYGTSATSSDSDTDGLLDKDEVLIYQTNPLKADTDGDGKNDGYEVRRNSNPLGEGRLLIPSATSSLKTTTTIQ